MHKSRATIRLQILTLLASSARAKSKCKNLCSSCCCGDGNWPTFKVNRMVCLHTTMCILTLYRQRDHRRCANITTATTTTTCRLSNTAAQHLVQRHGASLCDAMRRGVFASPFPYACCECHVGIVSRTHVSTSTAPPRTIKSDRKKVVSGRYAGTVQYGIYKRNKKQHQDGNRVDCARCYLLLRWAYQINKYI